MTMTLAGTGLVHFFRSVRLSLEARLVVERFADFSDVLRKVFEIAMLSNRT